MPDLTFVNLLEINKMSMVKVYFDYQVKEKIKHDTPY